MDPSWRLFGALVLLLSLLCAVDGADWHVATTGNDANAGTSASPFLTIQQGIDSATDNDRVLVADGTYTGAGNTDVEIDEKVLTVTSQSGDRTAVVISCGTPMTRFITMVQSAAGETSVENMTVRDCSHLDGGAVYLISKTPEIYTPSSQLALKNMVFTNNSATGSGGTIYSTLNTIVTIDGCTISNTVSRGGAISHSTARLMTVKNSIMSDIVALPGGNALIRLSAATLVMEDCTFVGLIAIQGNMLLVSSSSRTEFRRCTFIGSVVTFGMRYLVSTGILYEDCTFIDNLFMVIDVYLESASEGTFRNNTWTRTFGGLHCACLAGTVVVEGDTFINVNQGLFAAWSGALLKVDGLYVFDSESTTENKLFGPLFTSGIFTGVGAQLVLNDLIVSNWLTDSSVGGGFFDIAASSTNVVVTDSHFSGVRNINPDNLGGGVLRTVNEEDVELSFERCTFTGCSSVNDGGVFYVTEPLTLTDCTFADNECGGSGGVAYVTSADNYIALEGSNYFEDNRALGGAGGAIFIDIDEGATLEGGFKSCDGCSGNIASDYGDDFATGTVGMSFIDDPKDTFSNLDNIRTELEVVDAFGTRVTSDSGSAVRARLGNDSVRKGRLVNVKPGQIENGFVSMEFSLVGHFGDDLAVHFSSRGIPGDLPFEASAEPCRDGEVTIGYPPGTNTFEVCVEGSTQEDSTLLFAFKIIFGILAGITVLCGIGALIGLIMTTKELKHVPVGTGVFVLIGIMFGAGAVWAMIPDPSDETCPIGPWFWGAAFILMFVPIVTRLALIVFSGNPAIVNNNIIIGGVVGVLLVLQLTIALVWTVQDPLSLDYVQDEEDLTKQCASDSSDAYLITLGVYDGLILAGGIAVVIASMTNRLNTKTFDAKDVVGNTQMAIVNTAAVVALVVPFVSLSYDNQDAVFMLPAAAYIFTAWVILLLIYLLPTYECFVAKETDGYGGGSRSRSSVTIRSSTISDTMSTTSTGAETSTSG
eukprot:TRINITY_DN4677_c0_g1_i1.p1 TRINITY_DN4677_c0_g1~~TRINITY_DN4677_c0_g1_i1.p1  ORF type:complete len:986 (+),score=310.38 TRINITY_DN4677_c0_g1_i1:278-3235(+)